MFRVRRRLITSGRPRRRPLIRAADVISQIDRRQDFFSPLNPPRIRQHATGLVRVGPYLHRQPLFYSFASYYFPLLSSNSHPFLPRGPPSPIVETFSFLCRCDEPLCLRRLRHHVIAFANIFITEMRLVEID